MTNQAKTCSVCHLSKPLADFNQHCRMPDGLYPQCRECKNRVRRERYAANREKYSASTYAWRAANKDKVRAINRTTYERFVASGKKRNASLVSTYGITEDEYNQMRAKQGGACAICGKPSPAGKHLHIDHDHKTGRVRGLLCAGCNHGLGMFKDSPMHLKYAAAYLDAHNREAAGEQPA